MKAKSINNALESLRKVLHGLKYSKDVSKVDFDLYVYDSSKSNALSKKEENGYIIAISSYLLFDIIDDRQYIALRELCIPEENIFMDISSMQKNMHIRYIIIFCYILLYMKIIIY